MLGRMEVDDHEALCREARREKARMKRRKTNLPPGDNCVRCGTSRQLGQPVCVCGYRFAEKRK